MFSFAALSVIDWLGILRMSYGNVSVESSGSGVRYVKSGIHIRTGESSFCLFSSGAYFGPTTDVFISADRVVFIKGDAILVLPDNVELCISRFSLRIKRKSHLRVVCRGSNEFLVKLYDGELDGVSLGDDTKKFTLSSGTQVNLKADSSEDEFSITQIPPPPRVILFSGKK